MLLLARFLETLFCWLVAEISIRFNGLGGPTFSQTPEYGVLVLCAAYCYRIRCVYSVPVVSGTEHGMQKGNTDPSGRIGLTWSELASYLA